MVVRSVGESGLNEFFVAFESADGIKIYVVERDRVADRDLRHIGIAGFVSVVGNNVAAFGAYEGTGNAEFEIGSDDLVILINKNVVSIVEVFRGAVVAERGEFRNGLAVACKDGGERSVLVAGVVYNDSSFGKLFVDLADYGDTVVAYVIDPLVLAAAGDVERAYFVVCKRRREQALVAGCSAGSFFDSAVDEHAEVIGRVDLGERNGDHSFNESFVLLHLAGELGVGNHFAGVGVESFVPLRGSDNFACRVDVYVIEVSVRRGVGIGFEPDPEESAVAVAGAFGKGLVELRANIEHAVFYEVLIIIKEAILFRSVFRGSGVGVLVACVFTGNRLDPFARPVFAFEEAVDLNVRFADSKREFVFAEDYEVAGLESAGDPLRGGVDAVVRGAVRAGAHNGDDDLFVGKFNYTVFVIDTSDPFGSVDVFLGLPVVKVVPEDHVNAFFNFFGYDLLAAGEVNDLIAFGAALDKGVIVDVDPFRNVCGGDYHVAVAGAVKTGKRIRAFGIDGFFGSGGEFERAFYFVAFFVDRFERGYVEPCSAAEVEVSDAFGNGNRAARVEVEEVFAVGGAEYVHFSGSVCSVRGGELGAYDSGGGNGFFILDHQYVTGVFGMLVSIYDQRALKREVHNNELCVEETAVFAHLVAGVCRVKEEQEAVCGGFGGLHFIAFDELGGNELAVLALDDVQNVLGRVEVCRVRKIHNSGDGFRLNDKHCFERGPVKEVKVRNGEVYAFGGFNREFGDRDEFPEYLAVRGRITEYVGALAGGKNYLNGFCGNGADFQFGGNGAVFAERNVGSREIVFADLVVIGAVGRSVNYGFAFGITDHHVCVVIEIDGNALNDFDRVEFPDDVYVHRAFFSLRVLSKNNFGSANVAPAAFESGDTVGEDGVVFNVDGQLVRFGLRSMLESEACFFKPPAACDGAGFGGINVVKGNDVAYLNGGHYVVACFVAVVRNDVRAFGKCLERTCNADLIVGRDNDVVFIDKDVIRVVHILFFAARAVAARGDLTDGLTVAGYEGGGSRVLIAHEVDHDSAFGKFFELRAGNDAERSVFESFRRGKSRNLFYGDALELKLGADFDFGDVVLSGIAGNQFLVEANDIAAFGDSGFAFGIVGVVDRGNDVIAAYNYEYVIVVSLARLVDLYRLGEFVGAEVMTFDHCVLGSVDLRVDVNVCTNELIVRHRVGA